MIFKQMGIENEGGSELVDLKMETRPKDVLAGIARHQQWIQCLAQTLHSKRHSQSVKKWCK